MKRSALSLHATRMAALALALVTLAGCDPADRDLGRSMGLHDGLPLRERLSDGAATDDRLTIDDVQRHGSPVTG